MVTASTGVAATLLLTRRTAHSTFRIPLGCDTEDRPLIKGHEARAELLRQAKIIVIDEMTMLSKDTFNFINKTM